jgi:hypothetical protein
MKKNLVLSNFHFLKGIWAEEKQYFGPCERENNNFSWTSLELERIRGGKQLF